MGLFITIEGGEGAGKSTNIALIVDYLKKAGKDIVVTREPGGTRIGEKLRDMLLDPENTDMDYRTELLLMFAARAQHIAQVIKPALAAGKWVVCDRFTDATYAYQGGARGIAKEKIAILESWVQEGLKPDVTILLDVPVEIGLQRVQLRADQDRFEQEKLKFFDDVRQAYLDMAAAEPERFKVISAGEALQDVEAAINALMAELV